MGNETRVIVCETGREGGIYYTIGAALEIDANGVVIDRTAAAGWSKRELRMDALMVDSIPTVGELAPVGWDAWRS